MQEAWGEDMLLTSYMGVAMASGLSKNGSWYRPDAVAPVVKRPSADSCLGSQLTMFRFCGSWQSTRWDQRSTFDASRNSPSVAKYASTIQSSH